MKRSLLTPNRDLAALIEIAEAQGWVVTKRNNNHLKWLAPSGFVYWSASTPSDGRALLNIKSTLRRAGLELAPVR